MRCDNRQAIVVTRGRIGLGKREVHDVRPATDLDIVAGAARSDVPAVGHRLPEVLLIAQPVEARTRLMLPVPVELFGQLDGPVHLIRHAASQRESTDISRPRR
jgi:hypothetical protein